MFPLYYLTTHVPFWSKNLGPGGRVGILVFAFETFSKFSTTFFVRGNPSILSQKRGEPGETPGESQGEDVRISI